MSGFSGLDTEQIKHAVKALPGLFGEADPKSLLLDLAVCLYAVSGGERVEDFPVTEGGDWRYVVPELLGKYPRIPERSWLAGRGLTAASHECRGCVRDILLMAEAGSETARRRNASFIFRYVLAFMIQESLIEDFITPEELCRMMAQMAQPRPGEVVYDPACGTGRLLAAAYAQCPECVLVGGDIREESAELAFFNLYFSGGASASLYTEDFLSDGQDRQADLILSNPPYTDLRLSNPSYTEAGGDRSGVTARFLDRILHRLKMGGRCAVLVPQGFLTNTSSRMVKEERRAILERYTLEAVISLPRKIYSPYTMSYSSMLLIRKEESGRRDYPVFISRLVEIGEEQRYSGPENEAGYADSGYREGMERILKQWRKFRAGEKTDEAVARVTDAGAMRNNEWIFAAENYWTENYRAEGYVPGEKKLETLRKRIWEGQRRLEKLIEDL